MSKDSVRTGFEISILSKLEKLSIISFYASTRGWYFILSWCHRITGMLLVTFVWFHIYSQRSIYWLGTSGVGMGGSRMFILSLMEWILAIPVIFHAFNGGRLILYESFGKRNDESMIRWVFGLSALYLAILGILVLMGNQGVSPFLFWLIMFVTALIAGYGIGTRIWHTGHSIFWKLQRISSAFLIVMVPAYILLMHLNALSRYEANRVGGGIQNLFIGVVHLGLLVSMLYHGCYGIWSVASDYLPARGLRTGLTIVVTLLSLIFMGFGIRVILNV